jgi:hypothetical protein
MLDDFQARFTKTVRLNSFGALTKASPIREWKFFYPSATTVSPGRAGNGTHSPARKANFTDMNGSNLVPHRTRCCGEL